MEVMKQITNPKEYLQQARQIFEEREQEFQLREQEFIEKNTSLQKLLEEVTQNRSLVEKQQEELDGQRLFLAEEKTKVEERQRQAAALESKAEETKNKAQDLEMQFNLELERVRNERMKLQRMTADYEYKIKSFDSGIRSEEPEREGAVDLTAYILLSEHKQVVSELTAQKEQLQSEKTEFMKRFLEADSQLKRVNESNSNESVLTEEAERIPEERQEVQPTDVCEQETTVQEELTAEVLRKYLERNEPDIWKNSEIRHSAEGEQLYAEQGGLQYRILFSKPAYFDITAIRRNSSELRRLLEKTNAKNPGVQFRYEESEGKVYATGYFTNDMKPYELMYRIKEISNCFSKG